MGLLDIFKKKSDSDTGVAGGSMISGDFDLPDLKDFEADANNSLGEDKSLDAPPAPINNQGEVLSESKIDKDTLDFDSLIDNTSSDESVIPENVSSSIDDSSLDLGLDLGAGFNDLESADNEVDDSSAIDSLHALDDLSNNVGNLDDTSSLTSKTSQDLNIKSENDLNNLKDESSEDPKEFEELSQISQSINGPIFVRAENFKYALEVIGVTMSELDDSVEIGTSVVNSNDSQTKNLDKLKSSMNTINKKLYQIDKILFEK